MQRYSLPTSTTIRDSPSLNLMIPLNENPSPEPVTSTSSPTPPLSSSDENTPYHHYHSNNRRSAPANIENRLRQLEKENEQLTLSNIRLLRANRILKLDCDRIVEEQTSELKEEISHLLSQNVRLQRSNRLLQDDLNEYMTQMNQIRNDQIRKMNNVGPEYEYLVQMINLLYRQLQDKPTCEKTCCFTNKPLSQGFSVLTLPPDDSEDQRAKPQHICRPSIQSHVNGGSLAVASQHENARLHEEMEQIKHDREALYEIIHEKEEDLETMKRELKMKDDIVSQLENDFKRMEIEVDDLQKDHRQPDRYSELRHFPTPPPKDKSDNSTDTYFTPVEEIPR